VTACAGPVDGEADAGGPVAGTAELTEGPDDADAELVGPEIVGPEVVVA
jgi:hypothetical protein